MCFAVGKKGVGCNRSFGRSKKGTNIATDQYIFITGFGNYENKEAGWGGPPRDAAYNSFGGRSDRSKSAFFNDRGAGSRGRWVSLHSVMYCL